MSEVERAMSIVVRGFLTLHRRPRSARTRPWPRRAQNPNPRGRRGRGRPRARDRSRMSHDKKVVDFPNAEVAPEEEHARRLRVEVERLARLPMVEWMFYLGD